MKSSTENKRGIVTKRMPMASMVAGLFLVIGLIAAFVTFFAPAFVAMFK